MKHPKLLRSLSLALALMLLVAALPFGALAAQRDIVELVATDVTLDETHFEYTGEEIRPNVTVRVKDHLLTLDKDYTLEYKNNVEVGEASVVVTGIATSGYMGTVEHPFYIDPKTSEDGQPDLITIIGTDVLIDGTEFTATGEPIEPAITVTVQGQQLTAGEDYTLVYDNNVQPGTASVTVTGVADKGYTGSVTIHFTIKAAPETPSEPEETQPELITIIGTDVLIDGTEFTATGEAIEPAITVTVQGQQLTAGEDYTLVYENNVQPGTASVTVTGVADKGYTGSVTIHFTIKAAPETPTEPEETQPEETQPEETEPVTYKITKGNKSIWHKDSEKNLSFTSDGAFKDFESLQIDGKTVNKKYYTVKEGKNTVITLKDSFLQRLDLGKYTISIQFADGEAEGFFKVASPTDDSNPKTGDDFALHGWTALLFVSLTGIIGSAFAFRKKIWK